MNKLNHLKTFEQYSFTTEEEVNEGLFTSLKTDITKFLDKTPEDEAKADSLLKTAFAKTFAAKVTAPLKDEVLSLDLDEKVRILKDCKAKLEDKKVGILKLAKDKAGKFIVGGMAAAHASGLMSSVGGA